MLRDAEEHAEEDRKRKEEIETRNEADALCFRAQKALDEYKDRLPKDLISDVQSKIDAVKKALEGNNPSEIKAAHDALSSHMQKIGEAMQRQGGGEPQAEASSPHQGQSSSKQEKPDIEEAEVEILDDENKN